MPNIWVMNFSKAINLYRHPLQRQKIDFSIPIRNFVYNFYTIWILEKTRNQSKFCGCGFVGFAVFAFPFRCTFRLWL